MLPDLLNMEADLEKSSSSSGSKQQKQVMMAKVSISILVMSLPVLYVSFLHVPPATLFRDTTFWFLMSNSIIVFIAADSGMLFFGSSSSTATFVDDRPFVVSGEQNILPMAIKNDQALVVTEEEFGALVPSSYSVAADINSGEDTVEIKNVMDDGTMVQATPMLAARTTTRRQSRRSRSHSSHALVPAAVEDKSVVVVREEKLRRTATEGRRRQPTAAPVAAEEEESEYSRLSDEELNRRVEEFITRFNREIRLQIEKEQS